VADFNKVLKETPAERAARQADADAGFRRAMAARGYAVEGDLAASPGGAFTKRSEVEAEVTRLAKQRHPERASQNIAAARAEVWRERPDLAERYAELTPEAPTQRTSAPAAQPVLKGSGALAALDVVADELIKRDPSLSRRQARRKATELRPDLRDLYHQSFA